MQGVLIAHHLLLIVSIVINIIMISLIILQPSDEQASKECECGALILELLLTAVHRLPPLLIEAKTFIRTSLRKVQENV